MCRFPELTQKFANCLDDHGLVQLITNPTQGKNVLDLFITNNDSLIVKTQVKVLAIMMLCLLRVQL